MGRKAQSTMRIDGLAARCRVLLEPGELICRGGHQRTFSHALMKRLAAARGVLSFHYERSRIEIELGDAAPAWLDTIKNPRTRTQKLGVAPGMKCAALGPTGSEDLSDITAVLATQPSRRLGQGMDLVFLFAGHHDNLSRLSAIHAHLAPKGAVWVLWPKGRKDFAHEHVVAAAKAAGLVQTKSIGFSPALSGLRLVRPATK
ncbi:MAG: DUF3052 family protein [Phycisphaerales bacterium]